MVGKRLSEGQFGGLIPYLNAILPQIRKGEDSVDQIKTILSQGFVINLDEYVLEHLDIFLQKQVDEFQGISVVDTPHEDIAKARRLLLQKYVRWDRKLEREAKTGDRRIKRISKEKAPKVITKNHMSKVIVGLSDPLQDIVGVKQSTRTEIVKLLWIYIRKHNLQNPTNGREVLCDDRMRPVFGDKMTIFTMNKLIGPHLIKIDQPKVVEVEKEDITQNSESENNSFISATSEGANMTYVESSEDNVKNINEITIDNSSSSSDENEEFYDTMSQQEVMTSVTFSSEGSDNSGVEYPTSP
ncbi:hypothetical protein C6P45_004868 [Maudiozyma exigua]|uniref:DM2 domain-containing protein n=1 Tax=Maudiozyma exigua TaxID=34358 RepID=A0A9P7BBF3_MAUEX|nr:hypothetical protein C6P45_004868 [Kazachstania exigua]